MPRKVTELGGAPVVGRHYMVPCLPDEGWPGSPVLPFTGTIHNDEPYGFGDFDHAHYDFRFLPDKVIRWLRAVNREDADGRSSLLRYVIEAKRGTKPAWRKMLCLRRAPWYPMEHCDFMVARLESRFRKCTISPDNPVCPHRRGPLAGCVPRGGVVSCPLHGLRWDTRTGRMVESWERML